VGGVYKILAEVLSSLRKVVGKVAGLNQYAFTPRRQLFYVALIANEYIHSYIKSRQLGTLCKPDIDKAHDQVPWDFLLSTVEKMGFPCKWRNWASFYVSTMCFSIVINGEGFGFQKV